jgi:inward rectifier potassium channel
MSTAKRRAPREKIAHVNMGGFSLTKKGVSTYDFADPYRLAVALTWPQFLLVLFAFYLTVNVLFAVAYAVVPGAIANARPYHVSDYLFFSLETLATVGYGEMYPATLYGHVISSLEITTGLFFTAILTGLIFVRFSRPRAKFVFSDHPVITNHEGIPTLMLRIGNGRAAALGEAMARLSVLKTEISREGAEFRRTFELALVRRSLPVFPLSWTVMHMIDETSPLHGLDKDSFVAQGIRLFVAFEARDPTYATTVHDMHVYAPEDVLYGMRYADIITNDEFNRPTADLTRVSEVEPDDGTKPYVPFPG